MARRVGWLSMPILHHRRITSELDAFVDGELTAARAGVVAAHLGECADCRRAVDVTYRVQESLGRRADGLPVLLAVARIRRWLISADGPNFDHR